MINGLFEVIQDAIDDEADQITVSYDSELGYPTNIEIDYNVNAIDDEYPHCHSLTRHSDTCETHQNRLKSPSPRFALPSTYPHTTNCLHPLWAWDKIT